MQGYSDDLTFLEEVREAYLTHPLMNGKSVKFLFDRHCCRILSVTIVGNVESLILEWECKVNLDNLIVKLKAGSVTDVNSKINQLIKYFSDNNVTTNRDVIYNFFALKNLRNAIIHSDLDQKKIDIISASFIPMDTDSFDEDLWNQMLEINNKMIGYINELGLIKLGVDKKFINEVNKNRNPCRLFDFVNSVDLTKICDSDMKIILTKLNNNYETNKQKNFFSKDQFTTIYWNNIESICSEINEIDITDENIKLQLVESSLFSWDQYINCNKNNKYKHLTINDLLECKGIMKKMMEDNFDYMQSDIVRKNLAIARIIDNIIINKSPLDMFINLIPIAKYNNKVCVKNEAIKLLEAWAVKQYLYATLRNRDFDESSLEGYRSVINC